MEAKFKTNVTSGLMPLTVEFTDESTPSGLVTAWEWDFGDGTPIVTTQNAVHVYTAAADSDGFTVTLTATINYDIYTATSVIYPTSTLMGQHVKVQGNSLRWQSVDQSTALRFNINGELHVGGNSSLPANITTTPGTDLNIWSSTDVSIYAGLPLNGLAAPSSAKLTLNNVVWPPIPGDITPQQGEYIGIGAAGAGTLAYLKCFPYEVTSDTLTEEELNESYPGLMPGQQILAPSTIYVCVKIEDGVRKWRRILAP